MEPLVTDSDGDDQDESEPVARRSAGPAARTPRPSPDAGRGPGRSRQFLVDPADPDAFSEIDLAVAEAEDGDRVVVRPGTYRLPVVLDRAIELVGEGPREEIVLEPARAEALSFCASGATVRNLTI